MGIIRRAGAQLLKIIEQALDPAAEANRVQVYSKDVTGVSQLFARTSDGTIAQLTPNVSGAGTTNVIPRWTAPTTLGDSVMVQNLAGFDGIVLDGRLWVDRDIGINPVQDGVIYCITRGTNLAAPPVLDGGVQSFNQATYDCTAVARQSFAGAFTNTSSRASGANTLTCTAVWANAAASVGADNISVHGENGVMFNRDDVFFASSQTFGTGPSALVGESLFWNNVTVGDPSRRVTLGDNVAPFVVAYDGVYNAQIGVGLASSNKSQLNLKNTTPGANTGGIVLALDTTVSAGIRGGLLMSRGPGGGIGGGNEAGFAISAGGDFIVGITANDAGIFNIAPGKRLVFSADGVGFTMGSALNAAGLFVARTLMSGDPVTGAGTQYTSGAGAPVAPGTLPGDTYSNTTGGVGTSFYAWNSVAWIPLA